MSTPEQPTSPQKDETFRDSLATVDKRGRRIWIYPKKPSGRHYKWRAWLSYTLIVLDVESAMEWIPGVSVAWPFGIVPVGFALMAFRFLFSVAVPPPLPGQSSTARAASDGSGAD